MAGVNFRNKDMCADVFEARSFNASNNQPTSLGPLAKSYRDKETARNAEAPEPPEGRICVHLSNSHTPAKVSSLTEQNQVLTLPSGLLEHAREFAPIGFRVFPLHSMVEHDGALRCTCGKDCKSPGKHPRHTGWQGKATNDYRQIDSWFGRGVWSGQNGSLAGPPNIGIATGEASGLLVLDVDPGHGGEASLAELERQHGPLPRTWQFVTGSGGRHYLFRFPIGSGLTNSAGKLGPGLDTRGNGGFIVAPPSNHRSGGEYRIDHDHWLTTGVDLAELPLWIVERLTASAPSTAAIIGSRPHSKASGDVQDLFGETIGEGERNQALARMAGFLVALPRLNTATVFEILWAINQSNFSPPVEVEEVERIVTSITETHIRKSKTRGV